MNRLFSPVGFIAAGLLCLATPRAVAQQYMDTFYYKGSHNSYERGIHGLTFPYVPYANPLLRVPMWMHPLAYNCYTMELDICKRGADGVVVVKHECGILSLETPLNLYLDELLEKPEIHERFTMIHLEPYDSSPCCAWGAWGSTQDDELKGLMTAKFPLSETYTYNQFVADGQVWPTIPQLVKRGYHFAFGHNRGSATTDSFGYFFKTGLGAEDPHYQVLGNIEGNLDPGEVPTPGDRWLYRGFPNRYWEDPVFAGTYFNNCVAKNMNEIAMNEIADTVSKDGIVFPPYPMYIQGSFSGVEWGTFQLPYNSIADGLARIEATTPVPDERMLMKIEPGNYTVGGAGRISTHTRWVRNATSGTVRVTYAP